MPLLSPRRRILPYDNSRVAPFSTRFIGRLLPYRGTALDSLAVIHAIRSDSATD